MDTGGYVWILVASNYYIILKGTGHAVRSAHSLPGVALFNRRSIRSVLRLLAAEAAAASSSSTPWRSWDPNMPQITGIRTGIHVIILAHGY